MCALLKFISLSLLEWQFLNHFLHFSGHTTRLYQVNERTGRNSSGNIISESHGYRPPRPPLPSAIRSQMMKKGKNLGTSSSNECKKRTSCCLRLSAIDSFIPSQANALISWKILLRTLFDFKIPEQ